ncbi:unnamed protein product [Schistocephalus solidus]|uniref:C2H2-type domain-containing protein n=1 Tax=Schistocephalus solidus TaxID=70667 RepID=A0A183TL61_SCHSO|nr:unnamed protein product [Schistocephalus solidus]
MPRAGIKPEHQCTASLVVTTTQPSHADFTDLNLYDGRSTSRNMNDHNSARCFVKLVSRHTGKEILVNQCLVQQHTAEIAASTALTVLAHSLIAWAYSVTCASITTEFTAMLTTLIPLANPPLPPVLPLLPTTLPKMTSPSLSLFRLPQCALSVNSRIGLVGHMRIHRTTADEPVPGAPIYSRCARLDCSHCRHCSCNFMHHMGLLGHMCLHENLW